MSLQGCSLQESSRQGECFDQARDKVIKSRFDESTWHDPS
jgi:hypothetical protein